MTFWLAWHLIEVEKSIVELSSYQVTGRHRHSEQFVLKDTASGNFNKLTLTDTINNCSFKAQQKGLFMRVGHFVKYAIWVAFKIHEYTTQTRLR